MLPPSDSAPSTPPARRDLFLPALLAIGVVTALAGVAYRHGQGLTIDEPFMANMIRLPWRHLWRVFPVDNLPFAYVAFKIWAGMFGESEVALRSLSALTYGGAAVFTGLATRRLAGSSGGLAAAALVGASDRIGLEHAATARPYALLACIAAATLWQSVRLLAPNDDGTTSRRFGLALLLSHLLGPLTHPSYVVVAAAWSGASLAVERRLRSAVFAAPALALAAYVVFWGPIVRSTLALRTTFWMRPPAIGDVQRAYSLIWGVGPGFILLGLLLAAILGNRKRTLDALQDMPVRWILAAAAGAWALAVAISLWKPIFEATRTPLLLLPVTAAAVSVLLARCSGRLTTLAFAAICVLAAMHRISSRPHEDPYPTRASLAALVSKVQCGDTVIAPGVGATSAEYYFRQLQAPACVRLVPFPSEFEANFANFSGQIKQPDRLRALTEEAARIAREAAARQRPVWLLTLSNWETQEATAMMESALLSEASCHGREPLPGAFIDAVVRCDPHPAGR